MKFNKFRYRSSLSDHHLSAVLCISTSDIKPDFNTFVQALNRLDYSWWTGWKVLATADEVIKLQATKQYYLVLIARVFEI